MRAFFKLLFLSGLLTACAPDPSAFTEKNPAIREALERRRQQYAAEVMDQCRREAIKKADAYVDSILTAEIQIRISDSILFPEKPLRPSNPGPVKFNDTLRARPFQ
ncbi:MAG: hypothetical protein LW630_03900 [Saprospiraceae bacterium]|jgi:hypothetical protein|nr:hypothetical protein [Saprospiraceae bacterium]